MSQNLTHTKHSNLARQTEFDPANYMGICENNCR